ncbi:MAG: hypothetical protein LBL48_12245 [Azoarcus sp.]|jgi:hypothetical protein|nr:hypothetical protein [Azoarcus sp.]
MAIPLIIQRGLEEILPAEKPSACMNCDEFKKKDGSVVVFVELHSRTGHAAVFIGKATDDDRILYDPCGSYVKKGLNYRSGDILSANEFDYADYKEFHEEGDKNADLRYYIFKITKDEEKAIRERILDPEGPSTCTLECATQVRRVLNGIGPFRNLKAGFLVDLPSTLAADVKTIQESEKRKP